MESEIFEMTLIVSNLVAINDKAKMVGEFSNIRHRCFYNFP